VARSYEQTDVGARSPGPERSAGATAEALSFRPPPEGGRVLVLGWSRRMPDLLAQLELRAGERWTVDVLSALDPDRRRGDIVDHGIEIERTELRHLQGDLTVPDTLASVDPTSYDHVFLVASDWPATSETSDARTISTYIALTAVMGERGATPTTLVELVDEGNLDLFDGRATGVVVSPRLLSRLLAQVVLRPQLLLVVDEIFGEGATQLRFLSAPEAGPAAFGDLAARLRPRGAIVIGLRRGGLGGELVLAPPADLMVDFGAGDALIVLEADEGPGPQ